MAAGTGLRPREWHVQEGELSSERPVWLAGSTWGAVVWEVWLKEAGPGLHGP